MNIVNQSTLPNRPQPYSLRGNVGETESGSPQPDGYAGSVPSNDEASQLANLRNFMRGSQSPTPATPGTASELSNFLGRPAQPVTTTQQLRFQDDSWILEAKSCTSSGPRPAVETGPSFAAWFGDVARGTGKLIGCGVRGAANLGGTVLEAGVTHNPAALASRVSASALKAMGAHPMLVNAAGWGARSFETLGDAAKSAVRGVGEFGASTMEGTAEVIASPAAAVKGLATVSLAGADAVPYLGSVTSGAEAWFRGESKETIREENKNIREALWDGMVEEHKKTEERIGTVGAWVKVGAEVLTTVGPGAVKVAGKVASVTSHLDELGGLGNLADTTADAARLASKADEAGQAAGLATVARANLNRLDFVPEELAKRISKQCEELSMTTPAQKNLVEFDVISKEAKSVLERAVTEGRVDAGSLNSPQVQAAASWLIAQELKFAGVRLCKQTYQDFSPYKVQTRSAQFPDGSKRSLITTELKPGRSQALILARKAVQKQPDILAMGQREVRIYNASPADLRIASMAIEDLEKAPKLAEYLKEIQFERSLGGEIFKSPTEVLSQKDTAGRMIDQIADTVVIKKAPAQSGTRNMESLNADFGEHPIPDRLLREPQVRGTIIHEVAHHLDHAKGISTAPNSPFGKGLVSESERGLDFVSHYAQKNPHEDFAETVRFILALETEKTPDLLDAPISDALRAKLTAASEAIGSNPAALQRLNGW